MMGQLDKELLQELLNVSDKELTPKQTQIVQAAIEIFSEKGFAAASTSEIAKRAGVAEGTIFRHYKTKKELLISIVLPVISNFAVPFLAEQFLNEIFEGEEFEEMDQFLRKVIYNRYEFFRKNTALLKILLQEMFYHSEIQDTFKQIYMEKIAPKYRNAMKRLLTKEQFESIPTETIFRLTISTILGYLLARFIIVPDYDWDDEREIEYTIQFIQNGIKGLK
ncbi:TetR/AcrR family transcriptional regulator [Gracilibacillus lacisalsi]|uniref:TetR/AcrR family transcriptional regulator n=1 Tax=Gracilibacillus lacisalsi TaxID=393087 RepID=UPI001FDF7FE3|nr:TetR/AcrR family transcriptional regulator [Gracilibacillus lacisalsi]